MLLANAALSALVNLLVFAGLPFFTYFAYQKWRHKRAFGEISRRAGLQLGPGRYVAYSVAFALAAVAALADTGRAEDHEQIQVPCCKSADILLGRFRD
jgi:hypothetical protein